MSKFVNLEYLDLGNHGKYSEEKINQGIYNRFAGSLEPLKDLAKLKTLGIYGTDLDDGLEYLPDSIESLL